ncbi:unnamed protein product [Urochloa humidicola]
MLLHEAAAVLNLHAQAVVVQNVLSLVMIILDTKSTHFYRWTESMLLALGKYYLSDHVLSDAPLPASPDWVRMDCVVKSWIIGTLSPELADAVLDRGVNARTA